MKKYSILILVLTLSSFVQAQKKVSEYSSSFFDKTFEVQASEPKNGIFSFFIHCESKDKHKVGFILKSNDVPDFINSLNEIKQKFSEWEDTAKKNNVTDFDKEFNTKFNSVRTFFTYGSDWHFESGVRVKPYFKVTQDGQCLIIFNSRELTASDNQFMTVKGFILAFSSIKEVDEFINALDFDTVINEESKKEKTENLFK